jgi:preprotein translocase subunit SecG
MPLPILAAIFQSLLGLMLTVVAIFMILLVLVQRGRGGGLAGALGGLGGSSAFGARAGDQFTWITYGAALVWFTLCIAAAKFGASSGEELLNVPNRAPSGASGAVAPATKDEDAPADIKAAGKQAAPAAETGAPTPGESPTGEAASAGGAAPASSAPVESPAPSSGAPATPAEK